MVFRGLILLLGALLLSTNALATEQARFWQALAEGGKVLVVRHASIDKEFASPFTLDETCFSERNLNEQGELEANKISQAIKQRAINIDKVLSSPYCRTKQTAKIIFGTFTVEDNLRLTKAVPVEVASELIKQSREIIGNYQGKGNLVLVTHRPNILDLTAVNTQTADMLVLQPLGDGLFEVIAHLPYAPNFK